MIMIMKMKKRNSAIQRDKHAKAYLCSTRNRQDFLKKYSVCLLELEEVSRRCNGEDGMTPSSGFPRAKGHSKQKQGLTQDFCLCACMPVAGEARGEDDKGQFIMQIEWKGNRERDSATLV